MHAAVAAELRLWLAYEPHAKLADLGSYNLNGSVRDLVDPAGYVGFDLLAGPGVDVAIESGAIPPEHRGQYDAVVSVSALGPAPDVGEFVREILDLLRPGGSFFISTCAPSCQCEHTQPERMTDGNRPRPVQILDWFDGHLASGAFFFSIADGHTNLIVTGRKL